MQKLHSIFSLFLVFSLGLVMISCSQEDETPTTTLDESDEIAQEIDLTTTLEDVDELTLVGFQRNGFSDRTTVTLEEDLCGAVNIEWEPGEKRMTIDFGEGCTSPRGITRKGKIIVTYTGRYWKEGTVITTTFEDFFVNDRQIEGIRMVTNQGFDEEKGFFSFATTLENGKITWADGTSRTMDARHLRRVYLPNGDRGIIYAVGGGSRGVNRNGNAYGTEISEPLVFSQRCLNSGIRVPSAGIMTIGLEGKGRLDINFGDEGCDREVTITRGDTERTITLPRS